MSLCKIWKTIKDVVSSDMKRKCFQGPVVDHREGKNLPFAESFEGFPARGLTTTVNNIENLHCFCEFIPDLLCNYVGVL
ncbi:hypothetical protein VNO80_06364 [Phaseolus coccineus]|uniref:Uncharacterized protein n=1 Tax=Phaseolus coccineus TaxID=3886 RepID=A0AAN9NHW7_PHACN